MTELSPEKLARLFLLEGVEPSADRKMKKKTSAFDNCLFSATMTTGKLNITFTLNGKREYVPGDQVFYTCRSLFIISTTKLVVPRIFLSKRIVLSCFYLLIFYFEKFSTEFNVCRLPRYVKLTPLYSGQNL